jgi:hypothetical protein
MASTHSQFVAVIEYAGRSHHFLNDVIAAQHEEPRSRKRRGGNQTANGGFLEEMRRVHEKTKDREGNDRRMAKRHQNEKDPMKWIRKGGSKKSNKQHHLTAITLNLEC